MGKKRSFDLQQVIPLSIVAVAGVLLLFALKDSSPKNISAKDERVQQVVNKHLERTAEQLEMQRRRIQIENSKIALGYSDFEPETAFVAPKEGVELSQDGRSEKVAEDLGLAEGRSFNSDPMSLIQRQIFEEQRLRSMDETKKRDYARQFVENARRGGYEVRLSDDYKVLSVKPIRKPSNSYKLFDEN